MTVPCLTQSQLLDLVKLNGWEIVSTDFWEKYDRLVLEKNDSIFTLQCKKSNKYFYLEVVKICHLLKIQPPIEHNHSYYLHRKMYDEPCYCGQEKLFKECHGKESLNSVKASN
jgi:hypothetical protein